MISELVRSARTFIGPPTPGEKSARAFTAL
jgi:hypothetical protein